MTRCPSDATKPHPKGIAARLVDEWLEPVPHADKPDPVLLLNLVERIGSALHAAATEARRGALEEAEKDLVACSISIHRDLVHRGNTMWEGVPEILDARIQHIRAAIAAAKGETR